MKMKNMLIGGMSLALVACISVGGTLAYLTATDERVTNTFDFVSKGITLDLWETDNDGHYAGRAGHLDDPDSLAYTNLVSDQVLDKDVNIDYNTGANAYVFVNIQPNGVLGADQLTLMSVVKGETKTGVEAVTAHGWTEYAVDGNGYGVYYQTVEPTNDDGDTLDVFDKVQVGSYTSEQANNGVTIADIQIKTAAIQTATFDDAADAYAEIEADLAMPTWH